MAAWAKRRRCVVLADGSAIGCYQRNTHETHTVVLEPSGHTYSYIQPDGTRTRHLTPTALSSHRALVVDTLNLRNQFTDQPPYLHLRLMQSKDVRRQRRVRAPRARWPASGGKLKVSKLYNEQEKCFEMQSIEGAAKVRLQASGKLVELYYVVEVKVSDEQVEDSRHAHYATLHQTFAVGQTPQSVDLPVRTLLAAKAAWDKDCDAEIELAGGDAEDGVSGAVSQLPGNGAFAARPAFSIISTSNDGVVGDGGGQDSDLALTEILRVATLPSKFLYHRVVAEVTGEDATLLVSRRKGNSLPEIVVQLNCERCLLVGCDGFYTWYDEAGRPQHRFTRETIPPPSTIDTKGADYSVDSLCQHMDYVLKAFKHAAGARGHELPSSSPEELKLVEESVNEHGRFRAFRDGRIRVAFADRTILQVERDGDCCSFFFADGSLTQTTLASASLRHRAYIYQALEFGDWAFASQEERMQRHTKRQEAQAVVARELQRISVRCGMNSQPVRLQQTKDATLRKDQDGKVQIEDTTCTGRKDPTLSLAAVRELQTATLQHIASVNNALQMAASAAANDT